MTLPLSALVVGLGSIGRRHARNWSALGLGPLSVYRATGAPLPEPLGVDARFFDSLDEALAAGPDVVIVANPTSLHVETAERAVRAGCHVLVEKPLGSSLEGVQALLRTARERQRHVMVGYNLRFDPLLARMRALLHGGAIGRPVSARAEYGEYLPGWHPWEDYRTSYSGTANLGGGPVLTFSHEMDSLCWLLGRPARVSCLAGHVSSLEISTEDTAEIILQFEHGAIGSVHVDYVRRPPRRCIEVVGEEGVLRWEAEERRLLQYTPATRQWRVEQGDPAFARNDTFLRELECVAARVRARTYAHALEGPAGEPLATGAQGAAILAMSLAALQSAREGRTITLTSETGDSLEWLSSLTLPPQAWTHPSRFPTFSA